MSVLLDTGIVYAYYDRSDDWHGRTRRVMERGVHGLVLPSPVVPEVDHLIGHRPGARGRSLFYEGIVGGYSLVAGLPPEASACVAELDRQFADRRLGLVDAAVVDWPRRSASPASRRRVGVISGLWRRRSRSNSFRRRRRRFQRCRPLDTLAPVRRAGCHRLARSVARRAAGRRQAEAPSRSGPCDRVGRLERAS